MSNWTLPINFMDGNSIFRPALLWENRDTALVDCGYPGSFGFPRRSRPAAEWCWRSSSSWSEPTRTTITWAQRQPGHCQSRILPCSGGRPGVPCAADSGLLPPLPLLSWRSLGAAGAVSPDLCFKKAFVKGDFTQKMKSPLLEIIQSKPIRFFVSELRRIAISVRIVVVYIAAKFF